jgi:glycosyltransferase involved in cell wall biosynthesis
MNQKMTDGTNEIVVVDDCSTDNTLEIIKKFERFPNVHVIANETNQGVSEAANIGIRASVGQYVVRVDADDYISEWFIFFLRSYLEANHDAFGVACDYQLVDEQENFIKREAATEKPVSCGIMYRRDLLAAQGLYNSGYRHCEEEELRRRVGNEYKIYHLRMPLYRYRIHGYNKTLSAEYETVRQEFVPK